MFAPNITIPATLVPSAKVLILLRSLKFLGIRAFYTKSSIESPVVSSQLASSFHIILFHLSSHIGIISVFDCILLFFIILAYYPLYDFNKTDWIDHLNLPLHNHSLAVWSAQKFFIWRYLHFFFRFPVCISTTTITISHKKCFFAELSIYITHTEIDSRRCPFDTCSFD